MMDEYEFSDDEVQVRWEVSRHWKLPFGKHRGVPLGEMIKSRDKRQYLVYLCKWENIREDTLAHIECVLKQYKEVKDSRTK